MWPAGSLTGWQWDFGDGSGANVPNPSHFFGAGNPYDVTLVVTKIT